MNTPLEWALLPLRKVVVFSGRAPRAEYWWFYLGTVVLGFITQLFDKLAGTEFINLVVSLALLVPTISVTVRRLHDTDRTGWWILILLFPFLLVGVLAGIGASGAAPSLEQTFAGMMWLMIVGALVFVVAGITLLVFMVTAGTEGPNSYGPDPYDTDNLEEVFA